MSIRWSLAVFALLAGGNALFASAEEPKRPPEPPVSVPVTETPTDQQQPDDGSRPLFDGESLTNWKKADFYGGGEVSVKEGQLIIEPGKPMNGIAWVGEKLPTSDYELTFEAQRVEGTDFFVGLTFPVKDSPCTLVLGGWGGSLTGFSSIDGSDASENETTGFSNFENGKWYKVRLRVSQARADAWLDDRKIAGFDHRDRNLSVRIEVEANRPLGFATYRTRAAYRKIRLRELTAEEKQAAIEEADKILDERG